MAGLKPEQRKEAADKSISDTEKGNAETTRKTKEFKDLLPAAKEALQGLIDVQDKYGYDSSNLKKLRGAPALSKEQKAIMDEGGFITNRGGVELDPVIPSGNPLFDNPNADSVAWARGSVTPKTPSKESEKEINDRKIVDNRFHMELGGSDAFFKEEKKIRQTVYGPVEDKTTQKHKESKFEEYRNNVLSTPKINNTTYGKIDNSTWTNSVDKIISAAIKTGYPIEQDEQLMANPDFVKAFEKAKTAKEKKLAPVAPPQASIDTNNASKEFRSGYGSLKALESFTI